VALNHVRTVLCPTNIISYKISMQNFIKFLCVRALACVLTCVNIPHILMVLLAMSILMSGNNNIFMYFIYKTFYIWFQSKFF
jgi:hypothetical protein